MTAPIDDLKAADAAYQRALAGDAFWNEHYRALVARYPDEFVAVSVRNREVVDHDSEPEALSERLRNRGYSHLDVWVEFLFAEFPRYAL